MSKRRDEHAEPMTEAAQAERLDGSIAAADEPEVQEKPLREEWKEAFTDWGYVIESFRETTHAWWWTRPWKGILFCLFAILALLCVPIGMLMRAALITDKDLVEFYAGLADQEQLASEARAAKKAEEESAGAKSPEVLNIQPASEVERLFARRLIQLSDWHPLPYYVIAVDLARGGKLTQALPLMRKIAPEDLNGYPPAHAWLAFYQLTRRADGQDKEKGRQSLQHHLSQGVKWGGTGPQLRAIYAGELERKGEVQKAATHLVEAVKRDPRFGTLLASFMQRHGLNVSFQPDIDKARERLVERVGREVVDPQDLIVLAELEMIQGELEAAKGYIRRVEAILAEDPKLPRLRSELFRREYRKSIVRSGGGVTMKLELLDAALKADPTNPAIDGELNNLFAMGIEITADVAEYLRQKAAGGNASAVTHLILANQLAKEGKFAESIPHLEVGLLLAPKSALLLNNLAYALATSKEDQIPRAEKLISEAVAISGLNPDILETQGEIQLRAGKPLEAVATFEKVLSIDRMRRSTRRLLVEAYQQAKLDDMAKAAMRQLQALEAALQQQMQPTDAASQSSTSKPPPSDQADAASPLEAQSDKAQSDKAQSDKAQSDKAQSDKAQAENGRADPSSGIEGSE